MRARSIPLALQAIVLTLSWISVSLAIQSCSPLSLSQSKNRGARGTSPEGLTPGVTPLGTTSSKDSVVDSSTALNRVPVVIRELREYQSETAVLPADQKVLLSDESNPESLSIFKTSRTVTVHLEGPVPEKCHAYLGVTVGRAEIESSGWTNALNPVAIDCVPQQKGNWRISVSDSVSEEIWNDIAHNLASITFHATCKLPSRSKINLVSPAKLKPPKAPKPATSS